MTSKEHILKTINKHKKRIRGFGIKNIGLFGSYVRGEQTAESDIDILIDLEPESEKFDNFMALCDFLEGIFKGERIEVVTKSGLSPYIGPKILKEVIYV